MTRLAYVLLCHRDPDGIIAQARRLARNGDCIAIHMDRRASRQDFDRVRAALRDDPDVVLVRRRARCGWGEWSLVQATLNAATAALEAFPDATHLYLLSGDCMPVKSAEHIHAALDRGDVDHIESVDFFTSGWIRTGLRDERLVYRHWFNERRQKSLFYASMRVQRRLGMARSVPGDLRMRIGSQWWCLRRRTVEAVLDFCRARPDIPRFFRRTWIPDETFFQTLVPHLVPEDEIRARAPTFLLFTDYGKPVTFHDDHYDMLIAQDRFLARKISPEAADLKDRLGRLYTATGVRFPVSDDGPALYRFLTDQGRHGRRFAPRFWDDGGGVGARRELLIVACRKREVSRRLLDAASHHLSIPMVDHLFDDGDVPLPDLGGIEATLVKRGRHRRAVLRMLFDRFESDRMVVCVDPSNRDAILDFHADRGPVRLLEIVCIFSDTYLMQQAFRMGFADRDTPVDALRPILPAIRNGIAHESGRLAGKSLPRHYVLREGGPLAENMRALAAFFSIPDEQAEAILRGDPVSDEPTPGEAGQ